MRFITLLSLWFTASAQAQEASRGKIVPISPALCEDMKARNVMRPVSPIGCERLKLVAFPYFGFDERLHRDGEIVVMDVVAEHVLQIFSKLHDIRFPIMKVRLMNHYNGNDSASTADNNTSAFNAREAVGSSSLSMHAYGLAIDLNPVQNPYAYLSGTRLVYMPPPAAEYANRKNLRAGMAEAVIDVFAGHGFQVWGGFWRSPIDYQHFQVSRSMAAPLATMTAAQSQVAFRQYVERYRACRKNVGAELSPAKCIER